MSIATPTTTAIHRTGRLSSATRVAADEPGEHDAGDEVGHRVLVEQAEAQRHREQRRPRSLASPEHLHVGEERQCPEEQQDHVGGHDPHRERDADRHGDGQPRPEGGGYAVEHPRRAIDEQAGAEIEKGRRRANARDAFPANEARPGIDPSDQRRLGEVAERQLARPVPILRLVHVEIDDGEVLSDQPEYRERAQQAEEQRQTGLADARDRPGRNSVSARHLVPNSAWRPRLPPPAQMAAARYQKPSRFACTTPSSARTRLQHTITDGAVHVDERDGILAGCRPAEVERGYVDLLVAEQRAQAADESPACRGW